MREREREREERTIRDKDERKKERIKSFKIGGNKRKKMMSKMIIGKDKIKK